MAGYFGKGKSVALIDGLTPANNLSDVASAATAITNLGITATATELNILDGVTATTAELNILDGVTATTAELNILDGVTATTTELNYVDGVTSNIQTQLDAAGGGTTLISTTTISNDATVDLTSIDSTYDMYGIQLINVIPSTDVVHLYIRTSNDGGSTFDSGASDYQIQYIRTHDTSVSSAGVTSNLLDVTGNVESGSDGAGVNGFLYLPDPSNTSVYSWIYGQLHFWYGATSDDLYTNQFVGCRAASEAVNGVRFYFDSGNIASGIIKLFGYKKTV